MRAGSFRFSYGDDGAAEGTVFGNVWGVSWALVYLAHDLIVECSRSQLMGELLLSHAASQH